MPPAARRSSAWLQIHVQAVAGGGVGFVGVDEGYVVVPAGEVVQGGDVPIPSSSGTRK
jgi:hypothetical protein